MTLDPTRARALAEQLRVTSNELLQVEPPARIRQMIEQLLGHSRGDDIAMAWFAIRAIGELGGDANLNTNLQIVVTTPRGRPDRLRGTRHVLPEIIDGATRKLLVLGYSMTPESGLGDLVRNAASRGVFIRLVGDRGHAVKFFQYLLASWDTVANQPELWIGAEGNERNWLMHCKVVMTDDLRVLLGSANFTRNALEANAELGVDARDRELAASIELFFNYLRSHDLIERYEGT